MSKRSLDSKQNYDAFLEGVGANKPFNPAGVPADKPMVAAGPGAPAPAALQPAPFDMKAMAEAFMQEADKRLQGRMQMQREARAPQHLDMSGNVIDTTAGAQDPWKNGTFRTNPERMDRTAEMLGHPGFEGSSPMERGMAAGQTLSANPNLIAHRNFVPENPFPTDLSSQPMRTPTPGGGTDIMYTLPGHSGPTTPGFGQVSPGSYNPNPASGTSGFIQDEIGRYPSPATPMPGAAFGFLPPPQPKPIGFGQRTGQPLPFPAGA